MAKTGYIFLSKNYLMKEEGITWMKDFRCDLITEEKGIQEKLKPEWPIMLAGLKEEDTIVILKRRHVLHSIRELGVFLDLCKQYDIRLISIHDSIDSKGELFFSTTQDILFVFRSLFSEVTSMRKSETRVLKMCNGTHPKTLKAGFKLGREKTAVNMYNSDYSIDDVWKVSGHKSRTSVFRVLNRREIQLSRDRHKSQSCVIETYSQK